MDRPGQNCDTREHEQKESRDVSMFLNVILRDWEPLESNLKYNKMFQEANNHRILFIIKELYDKWMKPLIKEPVLTTATVCQLFLSLIVEHHLLPSEMKEQFSGAPKDNFWKICVRKTI